MHPFRPDDWPRIAHLLSTTRSVRRRLALERSVERLRAYLGAHFPFRWQLTLADNGSTDGTAEVAAARTALDELVSRRTASFGVAGIVPLSPEQLADYLPQVMPRIVDALTDAHPKVKKAGTNALSDIWRLQCGTW